MSGGFEALLKLSRTQTAESELAVQSQIASHQVQLQKKRREQEARERKERELEAKLRAKRFEEQRKEEERKRKREADQLAKDQERAKREEQMRNALKYGPRKASARPREKTTDSDGPSTLTREELRERKNSPDGLTREEKRQRKLAAELRRSAASGSSSSRRKSRGSTTVLPDGRTVRRLPGGAVDYTTVSRLADPDALPAPSTSPDGKTARERLAAMPSTLMKLNTVKRDLRTIDEILIDRAKARKAKTLAGDEAKEFSDWFGKNKKKESQPQPQSQSKASATSSRAVSTAPLSASSSPAPAVNPSVNDTPPAKSKPKPSSSFFKPINPKSSASVRPAAPVPSPASTYRKRPRSPSRSPSPPPAKRRAGMRDIGSEIWSIFGKDKRSYIARDVMSDDEDMEADAASVLKEEQRSTRLAHKEDSIALAEERRHEEEKRRRRKERERRERERGA